MTHITQGCDLCVGRGIRGRVLIKTLPIAVADEEDDTEQLTVV